MVVDDIGKESADQSQLVESWATRIRAVMQNKDDFERTFQELQGAKLRKELLVKIAENIHGGRIRPRTIVHSYEVIRARFVDMSIQRQRMTSAKKAGYGPSF